MRYTMNDAGGPPGRAGALMPVPAIAPRASTGGLVRLVGHPGNAAIPAPKPSAIPMNSQVRSTQRSYNSPDIMFPSIYTPYADNMHPPVALLRTNPLPVPAVRIRHLASVSQRKRRTGGQSQVGMPQVAQTWPEWRR